MGFSLKKFFKKVVKQVAGVALTAATGGALSAAAGLGRGLGGGLFSKISRNLGSLAKRAGGFLKSLFTRQGNVPASLRGVKLSVPEPTISRSAGAIEAPRPNIKF